MPIILDHIVLNVDDIDNMLFFYTTIIGLEPECVQEYKDGKVIFPSLRINKDTIIDLFPKNLWKDESEKANNKGLNHFCLSFDKPDWDEAYKRIKVHNVPIKEGPVERWGAQGKGISLYVFDPENNQIEIRYYPSKKLSKIL